MVIVTPPAQIGFDTRGRPVYATGGTPSQMAQVVSDPYNIRDIVSRGGTAGGGSSTRGAPVSGSSAQAEAQRIATEKARQESIRKEKERVRIEAEKGKRVLEARKIYQKSLREAQNRNQRQQALNQLSQDIGRADIRAQAERQKAKISYVTPSPVRTGSRVQTVSGGRRQAVSEMMRKGFIEGKGVEVYSGEPELRKQIKKELKREFKKEDYLDLQKNIRLTQEKIRERMRTEPRIIEEYPKWEKSISEKIKGTAIGGYIYEKAPAVSEFITEKFPLKKISGLYKIEDGKVVSVGLPEETQEGVITSLIQAPIDKPIKTITMFGGGYVVGKVGVPVITFLGKGGVPGKVATSLIKYGVPTAYGIGAGVEYIDEPDPYQRGYEVGEKISTELLPMVAGFQFAKYDKVLVEKFINQQKTIFRDISAKTGRTKTKQVKKGTKTEVKKKIDVDRVVKDLRYRQEGKIIRSKTYAEKYKDVQKILSKVKNKEELQAVQKLFTETYGEEEALKLVSEFYSQEIGVIPQGKFIETAPTGKISFLGTMGSRVDVSEIEQVKQPEIIKEVEILKDKTEIREGVKFIVGLGSVQVQPQPEKQKQREVLLLGQPSALKQPSQLKQPQEEIEKQKDKTALLVSSGYAQSYLQKQISRLSQPLDYYEPTTITIPRPKIPRVLIPLPKGDYKKKYKKKKKLKKDFSVFVRKFGKDVKIGEEISIFKAREKLKRRLKTTLRASGFIVAKGKRIFLKGLGSEFRPSKKDMFRVVQKRKHRLGTALEVREIQRFKKIKAKKEKKNLFGI